MNVELKRVMVEETGSTSLPRRSLKRARNSGVELEEDEVEEDEVVVAAVEAEVEVEVDSGGVIVACGRGCARRRREWRIGLRRVREVAGVEADRGSGAGRRKADMAGWL